MGKEVRSHFICLCIEIEMTVAHFLHFQHGFQVQVMVSLKELHSVVYVLCGVKCH